MARRIRVPVGFLFALVYLWLARPTWRSIAIGAIVCFPGLWLRALASGYIRKNEALATGGPYRYTRNPLYLGSVILALGFAIAARSWIIGGLMVAIFMVVYLPVILAEEEFLAQRFPEYASYAARVPRLLPGLRRGVETSAGRFSCGLYKAHHEYNALLGACAMLAALAAKLVWFAR
jgi:protein-S-isoprenylcysteine O-methyltransferase Ste14